MKKNLTYEQLNVKTLKEEIRSLNGQLEFKSLNYYYGKFGEIKAEKRAEINKRY